MLNARVTQESKNRRIWSKLMFLGGLLLFVFLSFGLVSELVNRRDANRRINDYRSKIEKIKNENLQLEYKIANWEQGGELEASARSKLGLEKEGEQTVIILRPTDKTTAIKTNQEVVKLNTATVSENDNESNIAKWRRYFFEIKIDQTIQ